MSPELFDPEKFGLKDGRPTKRSDCYALGMVVYEVLSGRVPFSRHPDYIVVVRVLKGEHPGRPQGEVREWFTDDIWRMLERCWKPGPGDRPSVKNVLQCLEGALSSWTPPSPQTITNRTRTNPPAQNSDPSTEESMDESKAPSSSSACKPSGLPYGAPGHKDLEAGATNSNGSDRGKSAGILDRVSCAGFLDGFRD